MAETEIEIEIPEVEVQTINDFAISAGENLPNHSESMQGRGRYVRQGVPVVPTFRTKQDAYRYAAWLITMAEIHLPDVEGWEAHDFDTIRKVIRNI